MPIMAAFAVFAVLFAAAAPSALAAPINVSFTVKKDAVAAANATIAVYELESKYWGLYQKIGAYAGSATTDANGTATINGLDSAKTYLAKITYDGKVYEQKFTPTTEVAINLTETSWIKGNIIPLLVGGAAVFVLLFVIAQIRPQTIRFGRL